MPGTVRVQISGTGVEGSIVETYDRTVNLLTPLGFIQSINVTGGSNLHVTPPTGTSFMLISPPSANTVTLFLGGTGPGKTQMIELHPSYMTLIAIGDAPAGFDITCAGTSTVNGITLCYF
jgi:hypothetical protein